MEQSIAINEPIDKVLVSDFLKLYHVHFITHHSSFYLVEIHWAIIDTECFLNDVVRFKDRSLNSYFSSISYMSHEEFTGGWNVLWESETKGERMKSRFQ